jgi:hypothetical protein
MQRSPVTVVRIEHTDLAFETDLAHGVRVEAVEAGLARPATEGGLA